MLLTKQFDMLVGFMMGQVTAELKHALQENEKTKHFATRCSDSKVTYVLLLAMKRWVNQAIKNTAPKVIIEGLENGKIKATRQACQTTGSRSSSPKINTNSLPQGEKIQA